MKRILILLCIISLLLNAFPSMALANTTSSWKNSTTISTWLWDTSEIVAKPDSVIKRLVDNNVKIVFLQVNDTIAIQYYKNFISKASANQISVYALDGSPDWVSDNGLQLQQAFIKWLTNYQKAASINEKFKGIHLDVEPYENDRYDAETNSILEKYQAFILKFKAQSKKLELEFGIDIPFWFYGVNYNTSYGQGNVAEWLCKQVKSMTIMAYRDKASSPDGGILEISAAEMKLFAKYNVKGNIAVETGKLNTANKFVTFYEEGQDYMDQELDLVYQSYKDNSAFNGISIHYFDSWMKMAK